MIRKEAVTVKRTTWPLAVRMEVLPGAGVRERFDHAARYGFDAVELPGRYLGDYRDELMACRGDLPLPVSSISLGFRGSLVSADAEARRVCREDTRAVLALCAELGAAGVVMPPVLHMDGHARLRDPGRFETVREAEDAMLVDQLSDLAECAAGHGVHLMLEPVNRYETDYLTTLAHAARICERVGHEGVGITADFFHMQIEELHPADALRRAGRWVRHVHVAENTRVEPGPGSLDFAPGFRALHEVGYAGSVVVECRTLSGSADDVLARSAGYLRGIMTETAPAA